MNLKYHWKDRLRDRFRKTIYIKTWEFGSEKHRVEIEFDPGWWSKGITPDSLGLIACFGPFNFLYVHNLAVDTKG